MKASKVFFICINILLLLGCSSKGVSVSKLSKDAILDCSNNTIGYAFMSSNGTKLTKVTTYGPITVESLPYKSRKFSNDIKKDQEIIEINKNGFCPNYELPKSFKKPCMRYTNDVFCNSNYTKSKVGGLEIMANAISTGLQLGTNIIKGQYGYTGMFDIKKFTKVIEENNLELYRRKIIELQNELPLYYFKIKVITPEMLKLSAKEIIDREIPAESRKSFYLNIVREYPLLIKYIKNPDEIVQLEAVKSMRGEDFFVYENFFINNIHNIHPNVVKLIKLRASISKSQRKQQLEEIRESYRKAEQQREQQRDISSQDCRLEVYTTCAPGIYPCRMVQTTRRVCK